MAAAKSRSGPNIPNAQRTTVQVLLRLPPDVAEDLDALRDRWGLTRAGAVGRLVERAVLDEEMRGTVGRRRGE